MKYTNKHIATALLKKLTSVSSDADRKEIIKAFAQFICKQNKVSKLSSITKAFVTLWNKTHDEIDVEITKAFDTPLNFPKEISGKKVHLKIKEDKRLIGGVKIKIDDLTIDNTLQTKINNLKQTNLTS